jgi:hypothetical protein
MLFPKTYATSTMKNDRLSSLGLMHIHWDFEHEGQILKKFKKFLSISHYICAWFYVIWNHEMVPDRTILHIVEKKIQAGGQTQNRIKYVTKSTFPFCNGQRVRHLTTSFQKLSNDKSMSAWYASYIVAIWLSVIFLWQSIFPWIDAYSPKFWTRRADFEQV